MNCLIQAFSGQSHNPPLTPSQPCPPSADAMNIHALLVGLGWSLVTVTLPYALARAWLRRIRADRRAGDVQSKLARQQAIADIVQSARQRGETVDLPAGWDR